jgi:hypothetical protein
MSARPFKPYPAYKKDSAAEWLGKIPTDLEAKRLQYLAALNPEALSEKTDPTLGMVHADIGGADMKQNVGTCAYPPTFWSGLSC